MTRPYADLPLSEMVERYRVMRTALERIAHLAAQDGSPKASLKLVAIIVGETLEAVT